MWPDAWANRKRSTPAAFDRELRGVGVYLLVLFNFANPSISSRIHPANTQPVRKSIGIGARFYSVYELCIKLAFKNEYFY